MQPASAGCNKPYFVVELLDEPLGLVEEAALPPLPLLEDAPPAGAEEVEPPVPLEDPLMPPVPPVLELELEAGGVGAVVVVEDDDEPPGTTTVSFVELLLLEPEGVVLLLPPGITVVVSFFSQALSARAARRTIKYPLRFMSTPFSFSGYKVHPRVSKCCAAKAF